MTCIAAIAKRGIVTMGGDSAGVDEGFRLEVRKDPKVFRVGDFVIGYTDSFRMGQILMYSFQPPPIAGRLSRYMATDFVDELRRSFHRGGFLYRHEEREHGGEFLVGVHGKIFHIYDDYQVGESSCGYDAAGCGADLALGSLHTTSRTKMPAVKRVRMALQAAEAHSGGVRRPFRIRELKGR